MWINPEVTKIGDNFLDTTELSNLLDKLNVDDQLLQRSGPLTGSIVIFNKQYFAELQGIDAKNYTGISLDIHNLSHLIIEQIKEKYFKNYTILKSEVSICPPGILQGFHIDPRVFHRLSKRVHIPIKTNADAFLEIEDRRYFLDSSSIWEFNNIKSHRSGNLGNEYRTHIIVDFIDNYTLEVFLSQNKFSNLYDIVK